MIDLHMHTTYSDGTDTVKELLEKAESLGLEVISITDHNTCKAYFEMEKFNVKVKYKGDIIVGCEFTTNFDNRLIEVLGYGFDYKNVNKYLGDFYNEESVSKKTNILYNRLLDKIKELDLEFHLERVRDKKFKNEFFERGIYEELVKYESNKEKLKEDVWASFSNFYRKGLTNPKSKLFINHAEFKPSIKEIVKFIHENGGIAFLAHPYQYKFEDTEEFLDKIYNEVALDGVECYYTTFSEEQTNYLLNFVKKRNLLISGGSDYHGTRKQNHNLGVGRGNLKISKDIINNQKLGKYCQ